jgi:hypothetical protein
MNSPKTTIRNQESDAPATRVEYERVVCKNALPSVPVTFVPVIRSDGPERLVCEAELHLGVGCGVLEGFKIVGFSIWRSPEGEWYVTFPSRAFGVGSDRRYFDYIRSIDGGARDAQRLKAWCLLQAKLQVVEENGEVRLAR